MPTSSLIETAQSLAGLPAVRSASDAELVAAIRAVGELKRLTDALGVQVTAELDRRSTPQTAESPDRVRGYSTPIALVAGEAGIDPSEAAAWRSVGAATAPRMSITGEQLPPVRPVLAEALHDGRVSMRAAGQIVGILHDAERHAASAQLEVVEQTLVGAAPQLTLRELRLAGKRILELVDPDGAEPREDELRRRSKVTVHQQDDGLTRVVALLHPEAAGLFLGALDARTTFRRLGFTEETDADVDTTGSGADDSWRPLASRRVDALAGMCRDDLARDTGQVAGAPVTLLITMPFDNLESGLGTARIAGIDEPISAATARRLASDAQIIPVVLGSDSEILDQGRATRLATPAQRRALALRDEGCIWPGCTAPPGWCEVAHVIAWILGGRTDLANLILLCPHHHRLFDHDGWMLRREHGIPWLIPPPHVDPTRAPRRAGPPPLTA